MADNRTMAQMLQAPIEGYEDAIVIPPINANNFELKQPLINLVQSNKFTGRQDPHNHLRFFNKVTSTFRHPEVPNTSVKLLLFPFSLDGEARDRDIAFLDNLHSDDDISYLASKVTSDNEPEQLNLQLPFSPRTAYEIYQLPGKCFIKNSVIESLPIFLSREDSEPNKKRILPTNSLKYLVSG
ncbi:hypothetical protein Tco_0089005 [Tanacetum coccineum]